MFQIYKKPLFLDRAKQKGVALVVTFFVMTILVVTVLTISTILFNEVRIVANASNAISSFYSSDTGIEKTLYYARKHIPVGGYTGACNICNACSGAECQNCTTTPLSSGGCDLINCTNCQITYDSSFNNRTYNIDTTISPDINPAFAVLNISSQGLYTSTKRTLNISQQIPIPSGSSITRVQQDSISQSNGSTINFAWPSVTTAGNTLIVIAAVSHNRGNSISNPITPPAGWSTAISFADGVNDNTISIFYKAGAASQVSTGNFTSPISSGRTEWGIIGIEYSGILSPSPLDVTASNSTFGTTGDTGTTATTTQADEIWVGGIVDDSNGIITSATNGFSIVATNNSPGAIGVSALEKIVTSIGTANTGGTLSSGSINAGVIATFKAGPSTPPPPPPPPLFVQKAKNTGTTSVSATWPASTTAGNLLVAVVSNGRNSGSQGTVTAPAGWTSAATALNSSGGGPRVTIFYRANAPSQASTGNFSASGAGEAMALVVSEYANIVTTSPLDRTAVLGNQNTLTPVTGTTASTTQLNELVVGAIGTRGGNASSPLNSFSILDQMNQGGNAGNAVFLERIVSTVGTFSSGVTTLSSNRAAGAIATFKGLP